jgi:endonuclease YncB( thermonuclease family)
LTLTFRAALALAALTLVIALPGVPAAAPEAHAADRDCANFDDQAQAQDYFLDRGGPDSDPDRLDADGDGVACDSLPCPCASAQEAAGSPPKPAPKRAQTIRGRVIEVIDGDTLRVRPLERTKRSVYDVRLIGIDTPETKKPGTPVECGGREATANLERIAQGRRVVLRTDPTHDTFDRYDRLLAYAKLRGGPEAATVQLRAGWAEVYVYGGRPFERVGAFRGVQRSAREAGRGVWEACDGDFHRRAAASSSQPARAAACGSVAYGGRAYVLYYRGMSCRKARRRVRHVHRHKRLRGWDCSSGSDFETGGYCQRGRRHFGWHPGD